MNLAPQSAYDLGLSVVLPSLNEAGSLPDLVAELAAVLGGTGCTWEIVCVDDGSTDDTVAVVQRLATRWGQLRLVRHSRCHGQSAALASGFRAARGRLLVTLDADGQNDPADLPHLLAAVARGADAACGVRVVRRDGWVRRASSRVGNRVRDTLTGVRVRDAGCAVRVLRRECLAELPVFDGLHRFLPTLLRLQGLRVDEVEVGHRPRRTGTSKYGIGNRALRGLADCLAVRWLARRMPPTRRLLGRRAARRSCRGTGPRSDPPAGLTAGASAVRLRHVAEAAVMVSELPGRRGGRGRRGPWCAPWVRGGVEKRAAGRARCSGTVEQGAAARAGGGHGRDEGEVCGAAARNGGACLSYAPSSGSRPGSTPITSPSR